MRRPWITASASSRRSSPCSKLTSRKRALPNERSHEPRPPTQTLNCAARGFEEKIRNTGPLRESSCRVVYSMEGSRLVRWVPTRSHVMSNADSLSRSYFSETVVGNKPELNFRKSGFAEIQKRFLPPSITLFPSCVSSRQLSLSSTGIPVRQSLLPNPRKFVSDHGRSAWSWAFSA